MKFRKYANAEPNANVNAEPKAESDANTNQIALSRRTTNMNNYGGNLLSSFFLTNRCIFMKIF